ncbi:MAG: hemerythrin domain-containing protein [Bacteroidia bacterium]
MNTYYVNNFNRMDVAELCEYIEKRHHTNTRETCSELLDHLKSSVKLESSKHPELKKILVLFKELHEELEQHFSREEKILFPIVKELRNGGKKNGSASTDKMLEKPLKMMNEEHVKVYALLHQLRELSGGYEAPSGCAPSLKVAYKELHELEQDLMRQFYLEENILNIKLKTQ